MITRIWHGKTPIEKAEEYLDFLLTEGTREYRQTEGNMSVRVWSKKGKTSNHFYTVTEWSDLQAIKTFAGDYYEKAVYYPEDRGFLLEFEEHVGHYECFDASSAKIKNYLLQLEQLYNGGSWQGECFMEKLKDVDEATAFATINPQVHCIAEIIAHCIYWRTVFIMTVKGNQSYREETIKEMNFIPRSDLMKKGWQALKDELQQSQRALIDLLSNKTDSFLTEECVPGYDYNYYLEGIIQHDIYHLGQIGLLKKLVRIGDNL